MNFPIKTLIAVGIAGVMSLFAIALPAVALSMIQFGEPTPDTSTNTNTVCGWSGLPDQFKTVFHRAATQYQIQPALLGAIYMAENGGAGEFDWHLDRLQSNTWPNSDHPCRGAQGPFQFLNSTWKKGSGGVCTVDPGVNDSTINDFPKEESEPEEVPGGYAVDGNGDNEANVRDFNDAAFGAARYLQAILKNDVKVSADTVAEQDIKDAAVAYNAGSGAYQYWKRNGRNDSAIKDYYDKLQAQGKYPRGGAAKEQEVKNYRDEKVWPFFQRLNADCSSTSGLMASNQVVRIAQAEAHLNGDTGYKPAQNNTPDRYLPDFTDKWCAVFVTWVWKHAGYDFGSSTGLINSTGMIEEHFKAHNNWIAKPQLSQVDAGDIFVMQNPNGSRHAGIIVDKKGDKLITVEGNVGNDEVREYDNRTVDILVGVGKWKDSSNN